MHPLKLARKRCVIALFHLFSISLFLNANAAHAQNLNETILYNFTTNATDGSHPSGGIIRGQDGSLYGAANNGGTNGYGIAFQINRDGSGYHVIHYFAYPNGAYPGSLVQATNGLLYGTASQGGSNGYGAVFKLDTNGTAYSQLHAFSPAEGIYPNYNLSQASNGVLYGSASGGGISNAGTVFRLNLDGSGFQVLHQFTNSPDGASPVSVIVGSDGVLYGTTSGGGSTNAGTVFKMSTNGNNYAILHSFTNSPDGWEPTANLIQGKDGRLYATTVFGGSAYKYGGTLFSISTNGGSYSILHSFPSIIDDGINPGSVIQGSDGFLYAVVSNGGHFSDGSILKANTNGASVSVIFSFTNAPDGNQPNAPVVEAGDGALYGTANNGGTDNQGAIFRLAPPLMLSLQSSSAKGTNTTVLSWPAWATDYGVRTSPSLASNAIWTAISAPVTNGANLITTNKSTASPAFFRLQSPP